MAVNTYNIRPTPTRGTGAYGMVPGTIDIPPSIYEGVSNVYPGLRNATSDAGRIIRQQMQGLTSEEIKGIQDEAARFGVASGLPMTNFAGYRGLRNLGLGIGQRQQQALENYNRMLSTIAPTVTDPALASQIATWNATNLAAPSPAAAARTQLNAYQNAMAGAAGGGGNPNFGRTAGGYSAPSIYSTRGDTGGGGQFVVTGPQGIGSEEGNFGWGSYGGSSAIPGTGTYYAGSAAGGPAPTGTGGYYAGPNIEDPFALLESEWSDLGLWPSTEGGGG